MKANELMIGDLVTFKDCQYDKDMMVIKIYEINQEGNAFVFIDDSEVLDEVTIDEEFVGIPLTPEILEKNGFKKCAGNEWSVFKYEDDDCTKNALYQVLWSADELYLEISSYTSNTGDFNRIGIRYVHELQHALKLCGIEKTIEL